MPSSHLIVCHPLLLLLSIFLRIWVFSSESASHQVAKVLEFQLQHQSFQGIFRVDILYDWLVWLFCLKSLKNLLQHHNSKASILQFSAFFMVQLSHLYMTNGKNCSFEEQASWALHKNIQNKISANHSTILYNVVQISGYLIFFVFISFCFLINFIFEYSCFTMLC